MVYFSRLFYSKTTSKMDIEAEWPMYLIIPLLAAGLLGIVQIAKANVVGSDFQNFNPTTNGVDFVTVQSGQTLRPGILNFGVFGNYAVNAIPEFEDGKPFNYPRGEVRNTGIYSDLNLGLGVAKFADIGVSFPAILKQQIKADTSRLQYEATGINEFRFNSKVRILGDSKNALAAVATLNMNRVDNNPFAGVNSGPIYTLELAGQTTFGDTRFGLNAGYRKKNPGKKIEDSVVDPYQDQIIASAAMSYLFKSVDTKVIFEFFGSEPVDAKATPSEVLQRSGEMLLGLKYDVTSQLALHAGATVGVIESPATPDWRVYAGINWNAGPLWGSKIARSPKKKKPSVVVAKKPIRKPAPSAQDPIPMQPIEQETIPVSEPDSVEATETFVLDNILFVTDSANLVVQGAMSELQELTDNLKTMPNWSRLIVEGHTDSVGDDQYNLELSQKRAEAIRAHMIKHFGFPANKVSARGWGETRPVADNNNFQGRQENRRVEIKIFD